jgi:hypothetical protein
MPDTRMARVAHARKHSDTFSNYRDWRAFLGAIQAPAAYATVATALKAGHEWLTGRGWMAERAGETYGRLLDESGLVSSGLVSNKTLGV